MMSLRFLPTLLRMMVNFTVRIVFRLVDRNGRFLLHRNGNVKENDRCLKNRHADQFLDQIPLGDHGMQTNQQKNHVNEIVQALDQQLVDDGSVLEHIA